MRTWAASASYIQNLILLHCHCCLFIRSTTWSTWNLLKMSSIQVNGEKCCIVSNWKTKWCCNHSKHTLKICAIRISSYFLFFFRFSFWESGILWREDHHSPAIYMITGELWICNVSQINSKIKITNIFFLKWLWIWKINYNSRKIWKHICICNDLAIRRQTNNDLWLVIIIGN